MSAQNKPLTLVEIRQFVAEERAVAEAATPGPLMIVDDGERPLEIVTTVGPPEQRQYPLAACSGLRCEADAEAFARSRTSVPALCDAVEALLAVVDALPRCEGMAGCGLPATRDYTPPGHREFLCDEHDPLDPLFVKFPYRRKHIDDLPYAATLRALLGSGK